MKMILLTILLLSANVSSAAFVAGMDSDALLWQSNVVSAGSSVSGQTVFAVSQLASKLKQNSAWSRFYAINPLAGYGLLGAQTRLIYPSGIAAQDVNSNFVAGDFVERGASRGITGNGSSKYFDTGISLAAISVATNSLSFWVHAYTTAGAGTSQVMIGARETAGRNSLLGWVNAGALETGMIATDGSATYAGGSDSSLTGLLGVNCYAPAINTGSGIATNTLYGIQGMAYDGTSYYDTGTTNIVKLDGSRNPTATNNTPFSGLDASYDHVGDPAVSGTSLYVPMEAINGTSYSNASIAVFSTVDLSRLSHTIVTNIVGYGHELGALAIEGNLLYAASYTDSNHIWVMSLSDLSLARTITLETPIPHAQGLEITNGILLVASGGVNEPALVSLVSTNGYVEPAIYNGGTSSGFEIEGLALASTNLLVCINNLAPVTNSYRTVPLVGPPLRGRNQFYQTGVRVGGITNSLEYPASKNVLFCALNNTAAPQAFSNRRLGLYAIARSLTGEQVTSFSEAVTIFNQRMAIP